MTCPAKYLNPLTPVEGGWFNQTVEFSCGLWHSYLWTAEKPQAPVSLEHRCLFFAPAVRAARMSTKAPEIAPDEDADYRKGYMVSTCRWCGRSGPYILWQSGAALHPTCYAEMQAEGRLGLEAVP